ncbi:MAG: alpha/beta fold hydrolase [Deltaproteobacteria bacterium]|nr:alpha/beta fold hydrolase [Deltaproteobacteria bacterium]
MRDLNLRELFADGAKGASGIFFKAWHAVNPDVWHELGCVSLSAYSLLLPRREDVFDRPGGPRTPVVLVHGLGGSRGAWWPLRLYLHAHGRKRLYAFGYEGGSIEEHAGALVGFVSRVLAVTGEDRVDIVAHSLGGIIARFAIQRLGLASHIRTLVTLATPHQGTYAAHYANTDLTRPLRPESDMIRDLNGDDFASLGVDLVCVCSDRDIYVVPSEHMAHPDARNLTVRGVSHSQHLISTRVFRLVARTLDEADGESDAERVTRTRRSTRRRSRTASSELPSFAR